LTGIVPVKRSIALAEEDRKSLDEVARDHVKIVLDACHFNRTNAARVLGIDRKTLAHYIRRWGIEFPAEQRRLAVGSLVAIEGIDGSGISTQARALVDYLTRHDHPAMMTAEPSSGAVGQLLRKLLAPGAMAPSSSSLRILALLFAADRLDHFQRVVAPALAKGTTVISDRWYHSSLAYQRTAIDRDWIMALHRHTRAPDVTVFLAVKPETGIARRAAIGRRQEYFHDVVIQREVVNGYRATIAELRSEGERIEVVDGEPDVQTVTAEVVRALGLGRKPAR
jgi:dTMP kinase